MPQKWELNMDVRETSKDKIEVFKDLSNLDLGASNHLAIRYGETKFAVVNYDKSLNLKSAFYIDLKLSDISRLRFYKQKFYILKGEEMHIFSFPLGFNMPFKAEKKVYKREFNDFTINRMGVFLFIQGYSELIAAEGPNPEGPKIKKLGHAFKHGSFIDSQFSTSILTYREKTFSHSKYFSSFQPSTYLEHKKHQSHSIEERLEHSLKMKEIPAPKESDPKKMRLL